MELSLPNVKCKGATAGLPSSARLATLCLFLLAAAAELAVAAPASDSIVAAAARAVQAESALSADLRCRIDAFGHQLVGQGSYQQLAAGTVRPGEKLLKLDLKVQLADQTITRQEICGPTFYYIRRESPLAPMTLGRVSLRHVRDAIARAPEPLSTNPNETWILLGGLPKLLESLHRNFEFAEPRPDELQFPSEGGQGTERLPVIVIHGHWRADRLAELRKLDKGVSKEHAEQLPDEVELVFGRADLAELPLFPYRITYFKAADKEEKGSAVEGDALRPLLTLELFNVHRDGRLTPEQFDYQPGEQEVADLTQSYLQRLELAKPTNR